MVVTMHRGAPVLINRLSRLMGDRRLTIQDVANGTGLSRRTLHDLYHDKSVQVHLDTINKLCSYFRVETQQLFEWRPDADGDDAEGEC